MRTEERSQGGPGERSGEKGMGWEAARVAQRLVHLGSNPALPVLSEGTQSTQLESHSWLLSVRPSPPTSKGGEEEAWFRVKSWGFLPLVLTSP